MAVRPDDIDLEHVNEENQNLEEHSESDADPQHRTHCACDRSRNLKAKASAPDHFNIFVVGKTGVGKSSMINSMIEEIDLIAKVQQGPRPCGHDLVEEHKGKFLGVPTTIYDTRGLGDRSLNTEKYVDAFREKLGSCGNRFLIFICQKYTEKFDDSVAQFVKLLSKYFKRDYNIWCNSILVLTQANTVDLSTDKDNDETKKAKREIFMADWGEEFKMCFQKNGIPEKVIQGMPVCIAGNQTEHLLTMDWKQVLFDTCLSTNQDKSIMTFQHEVERSASVYGAYAGAVTGGAVIPVIGAPFGMTVGALVGLKAGRKMVKKKVKEREEKRYIEKVLERLKKPGKFKFL